MTDPAAIWLRLRIIALMLFLICPSPMLLSNVRAQSASGTLEGYVRDAAGNPISNAKVVIINDESGNQRATRTDATGYYRMPFLPPGGYRINASLTGFNDNGTNARIPLNATKVLVPPITLTPTVATPVPVTPPAGTPGTPPVERTPMVNLTDPTRRGNFIDREVDSLPLGGTTDMRSFDELAFLVAGVAPPPYTPGVRGPGVGFGIGTAGQFAVNGLRARSNNFTIDGSDTNDPDVGVRRQGFVALVPQSVESIREFQISTLLWDSEIGRNFGSQVNAVSKDGSRRWHGEAFGFFTDSSLNARNAFDFTGGVSEGKNPFTRTQAGFAVTGPITHTHTQFFASYEHDQTRASTEQHFSTPSLAERRFLGFRAFGVQKPGPGFDPFLFFANNTGFTPAGQSVLAFYPLPNNPGGPYGSNTYTEILPDDGTGSIASGKLTHQFNEANTLSARYNFTDDDRLLPSVNRAIRSTIESQTRTQDLSLIFTTTLTPRLFNEARFSYGRTRLDFLEDPDSPFVTARKSSLDVNTPGGVVSFPSKSGPIGELLIEPFSPVGIDVATFPQNRVNNTFQFADSISWTLAAHTLKFGADIRRVQLNSLLDHNYRPQVIFGYTPQVFGTLIQDSNTTLQFRPDLSTQRIIPGVQLADLGLPSSIFQIITAGVADSRIGLRFTEADFFFNDHWRATRNFTLDYGVRYENNTVPHEINNRIEDALSLNSLPTAGGSAGDSPERTAAFNRAVEAYKQALGGRTSIYDSDNNNFGFHLGFAWNPRGDQKTVLRGGYGIYYDTILGAVVSQSRNVFPTEIPINVDPALFGFDVFNLANPAFVRLATNPDAKLKLGIPLIKPGTVNQLGGTPADFVALIGELFDKDAGAGGLAFTLPDKHLRTPYAQQWHLTLEREFLHEYVVSASYVGTKGTKLTRLTTPNGGPNVTALIPIALPGGANSENFPLVTAGSQTALDLPLNRPQPALGAFQIFENSANSSYHALQLEARKRYSRGYTFSVAYTWSHAIDDVSDVFPIAGAPTLPEDSFNPQLERGNSNFDVRHQFSASLIWDLPFFLDASNHAARVLGGWQLASIFQARTGQPFTLNLPVDANLDGNLTDRPSTTDGLVFFDGHGSRKVALASGKSLADFIPSGDGAVGRNTVRADGFIDWDLALTKSFRITERQSLLFRAEAFNVTNRANYGIPITTLDNPAFGSAVETSNPARRIQFALKYIF